MEGLVQTHAEDEVPPQTIQFGVGVANLCGAAVRVERRAARGRSVAAAQRIALDGLVLGFEAVLSVLVTDWGTAGTSNPGVPLDVVPTKCEKSK